MANLKTAKECPRKAFLSEVPNGLKKASQLRSIMKEVLISVVPGTTAAAIDKMVKAEFETKASTMFPFEAESEQRRMAFLIRRYVIWEEQQKNSKILAQDEKVKVKFAGQEHVVSVHRLVDRGNHQIEAIRYSYKAPESSYRSTKNPMNRNVNLLLLQLAANELLKKLKITNAVVYGATYSMKSTLDTAIAFTQDFEFTIGTNILSHNFSTGEIASLEQEYATIVPSATVGNCTPSTCRYCLYTDLCNIEFKKRKLIQVEDKEEKPLDTFYLTPSQMKLVDFDNGICRVNAVAGSGKTTVITLRTIRLLEDGTDPKKILMMTFTDKAKIEMKDRLHSYSIGKIFSQAGINVDDIRVETFNSWGQSLLDEFYKDLGFTEKPILIDDVAKKDIILDLLDQYRKFPLDYRNPFMNNINAKGCVTAMVQMIDAMKSSHASSPDEAIQVVGNKFELCKNELYNFYVLYNQKLVDTNSIDYEDQLRLILQLEKNGVFANLPYEHVIIDEFQDSNPNQIELISRIVACDKNIQSLVVVGDEMQAIYGFRNATPQNLVYFDQMFKGVVDINLEDNFRSQNPIIHMANGILERESQLKRVIIARRKETGIDPVIKEFDCADDETELFVNQAKKLIAKGHLPSSIAVLCRTKGELIKIQEAMSAAGLPTMLRVPEIMSDAPYVKAVIALASFFSDPNDILTLALYAKSLGQDPFDQVALTASADALTQALATKTTEAEKIAFFFDLCKDANEDYVGHDFLEELKSKSFKYFRALTSYCTKYKSYDIKEPHPTSREEAEAVTLITVHSAKGLEWPTVLLSIKKFRNDEEERRLLYVAVTRAKERLLITHTKKQEILTDLLRDAK